LSKQKWKTLIGGHDAVRLTKAEKEVIQAQLDYEDAVIRELEKQYSKALQEINERIKLMQSDDMTQSQVYRLEYQKTLKKQISAILDKLQADEYTSLEKYLTESYTTGFVGTMYDLHSRGMPVLAPIDQKAVYRAVVTQSKLTHPVYTELGLDMKKLKKTISSEISRGLASGQRYEEIARNISNKANIPLSRAKSIVRTDGHRIQQASADDARMAAKEKGADIVKQWDATLDGETRDAHRQLDGQIQEVDRPFVLGGLKAMYPGDFGDPAQDCNCRCVALTRARKALDADELATLKERANFFGLDKAKDFEDFENKYLKAAESLEKSGKSGIMKVRNSDLPNGLPIKGVPNTTVDKTDDEGQTLQRRLYDEHGIAQADFDTSDHNRPDVHPTGAHKHTFDHSGTKPKRGKPEALSDEDLKKHSDIIKRGDNYHDEN